MERGDGEQHLNESSVPPGWGVPLTRGREVCFEQLNGSGEDSYGELEELVSVTQSTAEKHCRR